MALLWIEGFEGFGTSTGVAPSPSDIIDRKYPGSQDTIQMDIETGRGTGYCIEIYRNADFIRSPNLTTDNTVILGFALKVASMGAYNPVINLYEGLNKGVNLHVETNGTISVYRNSSLLGTTTNQITTNTWYYIELKVLTHNSTGTVDIHVNGSDWLALTNQDTQPGSNAYHESFQLGPVNYIYTSFDDLYFLDGSGSANNDFLGNREVVALDPDGAGDNTDWTPSAGSNYENVDDGGVVDEDTTYNETSTDAHEDLYTYGNLPGVTASVNGVQITSETRVTVGSMDLSNVIKTGSTTSPGSADTIVSTDYVTLVRVEEQDPDTVAAWTPSGVNGAQFGIRANT